MKIKIKTTVILAFLLSLSLSALSQSDNTIEMADVLRQDGKIYTVVFGLVVILTGMVIFLLRVDRKIFRMEREIKETDPSYNRK